MDKLFAVLFILSCGFHAVVVGAYGDAVRESRIIRDKLALLSKHELSIGRSNESKSNKSLHREYVCASIPSVEDERALASRNALEIGDGLTALDSLVLGYSFLFGRLYHIFDSGYAYRSETACKYNREVRDMIDVLGKSNSGKGCDSDDNCEPSLDIPESCKGVEEGGDHE